MLKRESQAYIVHQISVHNKVLSNTLSTHIDVSEDTMQPIQVCDLSKIDILITELPNDHPMLHPYFAAGITVI
jgi:DeoR/GlpR family transcriptional regulator of sugar metabolism